MTQRVWRSKGFMTLTISDVYLESRKRLQVQFEVAAGGVLMRGNQVFRRGTITPPKLARWIVGMRVEGEYIFDRIHLGKDEAEQRREVNEVRYRDSQIAAAGGRWMFSAIVAALRETAANKGELS